jgi:cytochrome c biogenesis protein CcmG/thiol:disulfide interchange protein DsbE
MRAVGLSRTWMCAFCAAVVMVLASPLSAAQPGEASPDATMVTLDGKPFTLASLKGRVVVLDFWASWCAPCRKSFPFLDALQKKHSHEGLEVVGLTLEEDDDAVNGFVASIPVQFTILRDTSERTGEAFGIVAMPTTLLIGRDGEVAARFEGGDETVHAKIEAAVTTLLAGQSLPPGTGVVVAASVEAKGDIKAWQRGYLADPIMSLDGDALTRIMREHIHASKEGASGDGGASGGGCGCN